MESDLTPTQQFLELLKHLKKDGIVHSMEQSKAKLYGFSVHINKPFFIYYYEFETDEIFFSFQNSLPVHVSIKDLKKWIKEVDLFKFPDYIILHYPQYFYKNSQLIIDL